MLQTRQAGMLWALCGEDALQEGWATSGESQMYILFGIGFLLIVQVNLEPQMTQQAMLTARPTGTKQPTGTKHPAKGPVETATQVLHMLPLFAPTSTHMMLLQARTGRYCASPGTCNLLHTWGPRQAMNAVQAYSWPPTTAAAK